MKRSTPLRPGKPLERKTPLRQGTAQLARSRLKPRGKVGRRFKSYVPNRAYQAFVRDRKCSVPSCPIYWPCEFDHIKTRGAGGKDEANGWPLCTEHHMRRHDIGLRSFAKQFHLDPEAIAGDLWITYEKEKGISL